MKKGRPFRPGSDFPSGLTRGGLVRFHDLPGNRANGGLASGEGKGPTHDTRRTQVVRRVKGTTFCGDQLPHSADRRSFRHCFTLFTECFAPFDHSTSALSVPSAILRRNRHPTAGFMLHYQATLLQRSGARQFGTGPVALPAARHGSITLGHSAPFQVERL